MVPNDCSPNEALSSAISIANAFQCINPRCLDQQLKDVLQPVAVGNHFVYGTTLATQENNQLDIAGEWFAVAVPNDPAQSLSLVVPRLRCALQKRASDQQRPLRKDGAGPPPTGALLFGCQYGTPKTGKIRAGAGSCIAAASTTMRGVALAAINRHHAVRFGFDLGERYLKIRFPCTS